MSAPQSAARIELHTDEHGGVSVVVDDQPQSYVLPSDPGMLGFEYVQHMAAVLDLLPPGRLGVTHVGGAGLTLARYVQHTRPGSPQIVLEPDEALTAEVRRVLPLPRGHRVRVRPVTGEEGILALHSAAADALVLDAFAGGSVPAALTTLEFLTQVRRVLRPSGVFLANLPDEPGMRFVARVAAAAGEAGLTHRVLVATHDVLKGRRFGNVVLVASPEPIDVAELRRALTRSPFPTGVRADVGSWCSAVKPSTAAEPALSPTAPTAKGWRVR
ncbi:spermidine synthase [Gephyromycinifex aptenodytis]|uniref:spermidine synthase n=1 Tax=Gephyromycinifex aptenodytis TaxID=2716227 RepID=UPI0014466B0E|nr:fused MFS/spermidine synthase [Gephyromycinifex aptenodytis]